MKHISNREDFLKKVYEYSQGIQDYIGLVDYTMLGMDATEEDIIGLCERAKEYGVATVCVRPHMVKLSSTLLQDSDVGVTTVISFPEGTDTLEEKISETKKAIANGADDIDMVLDYQKLIETYPTIPSDAEIIIPDEPIMGRKPSDEELEQHDNTHQYLFTEVNELSKICHNNGKILKVIVESGKLSNQQTKIATEICIEANADFIKTSTGMVDVGAELDKIKIFYDTIKSEGSNMLIKASGGIRTLEDIKKFAPYTDRFGIGSGSVDNMMKGTESEEVGY